MDTSRVALPSNHLLATAWLALALLLVAAACSSGGSAPTKKATTTTTTMPVALPPSTTPSAGIGLAMLAARFECTGLTYDTTIQEGAVESGTCTYGGQTYEVVTYPVGSDVNAFNHTNLCTGNSFETIITPRNANSPQWIVAPATTVADTAAPARIASALDGKIALVNC